MEVRSLAAGGVREVTLLGQIVNAYGRGMLPRKEGKSPFVQLLETLHEIEGIERIRFTSPHPTSFGNDLIDAFGRLPKLGSYAHLPMQSGSDRILKAMNRPYSIERFLDIVRKLREAIPGMRLSTDVIVGFPGETEKTFSSPRRLSPPAVSRWALSSSTAKEPEPRRPSSRTRCRSGSRRVEIKSYCPCSEAQSLASNKRLVGKSMEVLVEGAARKEKKTHGSHQVLRKVVFEARPT